LSAELEALKARLIAGELLIGKLPRTDPRYGPSLEKWEGLLAEYERRVIDLAGQGAVEGQAVRTVAA